MIGQKMQKIDFPVRFSGQVIEIALAIQLHYSANLLTAIFQAGNNIFQGSESI